MLFNSYIFIFLFLPLCLLGYYVLNHFEHYKLGQVFVVLMSLWFYGYFNISYLFVIVASILINYFLYRQIGKNHDKPAAKVLLAAGVVINVGMLIYFKYIDFAIENINVIFKKDIPFLNIVLPLGISFFTFQQLSFVIDAYKKEVPDYDFLNYASFVTFFPQLIAGPIVLHSELVPQFMDKAKKKFNIEDFSRGIYLFTIGLSKKVLLADTLGEGVNWGFQMMSSLNTTSVWVVMIAYTFQLYLDFSGYSDMATGIAKMFSIDLPLNFNSPYRALDMEDFWKRWHMTLTRFFTKYVYIPLGGNRKGKIRTNLNILAVYVISGIWHGAGWNYLVWGFSQGLLILIARGTRDITKKVPAAIRWFFTQASFLYMLIIFRASSLSESFFIMKKTVTFDFGKIDSDLYKCFFNTDLQILNKVIPFNEVCSFSAVIIWFAISLVVCLWKKNAVTVAKELKINKVNAVAVALLLFWCICSLSGVTTFLYFNF